jgi:predicted AlkP superfamily pyrophosphatase or phosphodiesterase
LNRDFSSDLVKDRDVIVSAMTPAPVIPNYAADNLTGIIPGCLLGRPSQRPQWFPQPLQDAERIVLLVIDGLGYEQLQSHAHLAPHLMSLEGRSITTIAPSTTASALTSLVTGASPAEHGIVGYRMDMGDSVMNSLRWWSDTRDLRKVHPPATVQPIPPFVGISIPVVSRTELEGSAFTEAHLRGSRPCGWRAASSIVAQCTQLIAAGEKFVYAYYDGVDKIAHERGFGAYYDAEIAATDWLVGTLLNALPSGTTLAVTADHGQVQVDDNVVHLSEDIKALVHHQSGEGRFRWLHAKRGQDAELLQATSEAYSNIAWVASRDQVVDDAWLGPARGGRMADQIKRRLGDVALVPFTATTFDDPLDSGPFSLICRHGSLTAAEMFVPFLARTT